MSVVQEYWSGVLARLQAEVESFNRLIVHQGERGRENELALARVLERLVPGRYGIGSGLLIDHVGEYSRQMDIVVHDKTDEPTLLAQTTQVLFPVESTRVVIEVKTTLDEGEIVDAGRKKASIRGLTSTSGKHPTFALVAFQAGQKAKTLVKHLRSLDPDERPDLVCVLELGLVAGRLPRLVGAGSETTADYVAGLALLHETDGDGMRMSGTFRTPAHDDFASEVVVDGVAYPVVDAPGGAFVGEPSRALLLLSHALLADLAAQEGRSRITLTHYLDATTREILDL